MWKYMGDTCIVLGLLHVSMAWRNVSLSLPSVATQAAVAAARQETAPWDLLQDEPWQGRMRQDEGKQLEPAQLDECSGRYTVLGSP